MCIDRLFRNYSIILMNLGVLGRKTIKFTLSDEISLEDLLMVCGDTRAFLHL